MHHTRTYVYQSIPCTYLATEALSLLALATSMRVFSPPALVILDAMDGCKSQENGKYQLKNSDGKQ